MKHRNTILLSLGITYAKGIYVPASDELGTAAAARLKGPTPLEIAAFWTPERQRSVVSRDVAIDIGTGAAFVRQADGIMAPMNDHAPLFSSSTTGAGAGANVDSDPTGSPSEQSTKVSIFFGVS